MSRVLNMQIKIWLKVNARNPLFWAFIVCMCFGMDIFMRSLSTERDAISGIYEQTGMLIFGFSMASAFSLDVDSRFMDQLRTYPVRRWVLLFERACIGYMAGTLLVVVLALAFLPGIHIILHLRYLLFMLPVYWSFGAITVLCTILVRHTLGGILVALVMWGAAMSRTMGELSPIILHFTGVELVVSNWGVNDQMTWEPWVISNRLFFIGMGLIVWFGTWIIFTRWKRK